MKRMQLLWEIIPHGKGLGYAQQRIYWTLFWEKELIGASSMGGPDFLFSGSRGKGRNGISMPCWGMPVNRLIKKKARASMVDMHGFV